MRRRFGGETFFGPKEDRGPRGVGTWKYSVTDAVEVLREGLVGPSRSTEESRVPKSQEEVLPGLFRKVSLGTSVGTPTGIFPGTQGEETCGRGPCRNRVWSPMTVVTPHYFS